LARSSERKAPPALGRRLLAAAVLVPLCIFIFIRGEWLFALTVAAVAVRLLHEYAALARVRGQERLFELLLPLIIVELAAFWVWGQTGGIAAFSIAALLLLSGEALRGRIEGATARVGEWLLVLFYLGVLPGHWLLLRELPLAVGLPYEAGGHWLLYGAGITWLGDTFAYFVGSLVGRHPLPSRVSPRKSVEGVLGGLGGALLTAWLLARFWAPFLTLWQALAAGLLLSVFGQLGDLFESLLKRDAAVKDSGQLIPGHGGFLDRVDSLLFTLPVLYYFLRWAIF